MRLTDPELQTLRAFNARPEGQGWINLLKKMLDDVDEKLRRVAGEDLLRYQGRAQQLEELVKLAEGAPQALKRTEQPAPTKMASWR
jgi:hypothetical protein